MSQTLNSEPLAKLSFGWLRKHRNSAQRAAQQSRQRATHTDRHSISTETERATTTNSSADTERERPYFYFYILILNKTLRDASKRTTPPEYTVHKKQYIILIVLLLYSNIYISCIISSYSVSSHSYLQPCRAFLPLSF